MKFRVAFTIRLYGHVEVEAENYDDAARAVEDITICELEDSVTGAVVETPEEYDDNCCLSTEPKQCN